MKTFLSVPRHVRFFLTQSERNVSSCNKKPSTHIKTTLNACKRKLAYIRVVTLKFVTAANIAKLDGF
jgi:hypothetical protein